MIGGPGCAAWPRECVSTAAAAIVASQVLVWVITCIATACRWVTAGYLYYECCFFVQDSSCNYKVMPLLITCTKKL